MIPTTPSIKNIASNYSNSPIQEELDFNLDFRKENEKFNTVFLKVTQILETGSSEEQLSQLKNLAYQLFAGTKFVTQDLSRHLKILTFIFYAKNPNSADVASVLLRSLEEMLKNRPLAQLALIGKMKDFCASLFINFEGHV